MSPDTNKSDQWQVDLDIFEGPLDLLLHLINQLEIDIYDIPIAKITDQYLAYIHSMEVLKLDVAGDYLVLAATLMSIKSQLLVPRTETFSEAELDNFETDADPRDYLVDLLLEYRKFKNVAVELSELENKRALKFTRDQSDLSELQEKVPLRQGELSLDHLVQSMEYMINYQSTDIHETLIHPEELSVEERANQLLSVLRSPDHRQGLYLKDLVTLPDRKNLVTTFLALLELIKESQVYASQANAYEDILITSIDSRDNHE